MEESTLEQELCEVSGLRYSKYKEFIKEHHPNIDKNVELRKKYQTDEEWANYKVGLFENHRFKFMIDYAAETNSPDILPQN